jgi:hypothetical protein
MVCRLSSHAGPQSRIKRYKDRAEECMSIADAAKDPKIRVQYMHLAESYLKLVEIELNKIESEPRQRSPGVGGP